MRIHLANKYTFKATFFDADEQPLTPDAESAELTVINGGVDIVTVPATITGDEMSADVPSLPDIDYYLLRWTATVGGEDIELIEDVDLTSKPYFKIAELIAWDPSAALDQKPAEKLKSARDEAETIIEKNADVAFVPRSGRTELQGDGSTRLLLPDVECRRIISVTADGVPIASNTLTLHRWGAIDNPAGWNGWIVVHYEHGYSIPPEDIKTAALILATSKASLSGVPSRALSQNIDGGFIRFAVAGRDGATGIPDVDAAIEQNSRHRLAVG